MIESTTVNELPTDSELLAAPGGAYAVLRRLRARAIETAPTSHSSYPPSHDPWARPHWDSDTLFLPLYV